ncbi:MAG: NADPH-dependent F420 reductase [Chloroflexi bacterium]|nr:NADPH-dependent F420 reductase [Chloroflexota bacterium]
MTSGELTVGLIGGTGPEGRGLALRFAQAGLAVRIGSRRAERAGQAANDVRAALPPADVTGHLNAAAVAGCDLVVVVVPYDGHAATLTDLRDAIGEKIVIDTVVPLSFSGGVPGTVAVAEGSATQQAQALLPTARVVGAFHNLSAQKLQDLDAPMQGDVLVTGDDAEAKAAVMGLVARIPDLRPVDAGPLAISKLVEDLTALILSVNRRYGAHAAVRMVGVEP